MTILCQRKVSDGCEVVVYVVRDSYSCLIVYLNCRNCRLSGTIAEAGRCRCWGAADFSSVFWCVEEKSDSGHRYLNPGPERS